MATYKHLDFEPTDDFCGLFKVEDEKTNQYESLTFPEPGTKCKFKVKKGNRKYAIFEGVVMEKYGDSHISVLNLTTGLRESFFLYDLKCKVVTIKPL